MSFWSKLFGGGGGGGNSPETAKAIKSADHHGFLIEATPYKDGGQWQLAGRISKGGKVHTFVRADKFTSAEDAADIAISKGMLIVDQQGERIFS